MSHPAINRWGSTTYWSTLWYSDTRYALNLKQDRAFEEMIYSYLQYGTRSQQPLFVNNFWLTKPTLRKEWRQLQRSYFRWFTKKTLLETERPQYRLRYEFLDAYYMRLWVLKFDSWLIFNLHWFQPLKRKRLAKRRAKEFFFFSTATPYQVPRWERSRLQLLHLITYYWAHPTRYIF